MKFKLLLLFSAVLLSFSCSAQSFFKPLPKLSKTDKFALGVSADSTMNAIRPVANIASYGFSNGSGSVMSGAGVSYQHLKYDAIADKWTSVWSVNALAWYSAPLNSDQSTAFAYGVAVGFLNNLILVGGAYDGHRVFPTLGIGISLNN